MGFYFKQGFNSNENPKITHEMAEKLLMKLFEIDNKSPKLPSEVYKKEHEDASSACAHIGDYIYDLMFYQDFSSIDITITKDQDNQLIFKLNKTEL